MADNSYPNEFIGFFVLDKTHDGKVTLKCLESETVRKGPRGFFVSPQSVVTTAYTMADGGRRVLGTVHSHPLGRSPSFSDADEALQWWGDWHLVCVMRTEIASWDFIWAAADKGKRRPQG